MLSMGEKKRHFTLSLHLWFFPRLNRSISFLIELSTHFMKLKWGFSDLHTKWLDLCTLNVSYHSLTRESHLMKEWKLKLKSNWIFSIVRDAVNFNRCEIAQNICKWWKSICTCMRKNCQFSPPFIASII